MDKIKINAMEVSKSDKEFNKILAEIQEKVRFEQKQSADIASIKVYDCGAMDQKSFAK